MRYAENKHKTKKLKEREEEENPVYIYLGHASCAWFVFADTDSQEWIHKIQKHPTIHTSQLIRLHILVHIVVAQISPTNASQNVQTENNKKQDGWLEEWKQTYSEGREKLGMGQWNPLQCYSLIP